MDLSKFVLQERKERKQKVKIERKIKRKGESGSETQTETAHFFGSEKKNRREGIFF